MQTRTLGAIPLIGLATLWLGGSGDTRAQQEEKAVKLQDFDESGAGFSFRAGKVLKAKPTDALTLDIDLILDLPQGLGTNNAQLSPDFKGRGGLLDLGKKPLKEVKEAPKIGYVPALSADTLREGHTYCVLTADGEHYGKLHIVMFDKERGVLEFTWQYQPKATNVFE